MDNLLQFPKKYGLSKQRNKHIQHVLVEAAKLAPRQDHDLALVYETEKQKGNGNRATLAVARKMVAYLLAVDRGKRDFVPAEDRRSAAASPPPAAENIRIPQSAGCQVLPFAD